MEIKGSTEGTHIAMDTVNTEPIRTNALCRLMKELGAGVTDLTCYSENEVYHIFEIKKRNLRKEE